MKGIDLFVLIFVIFSASCITADDPVLYDYGIMFDCGSSSTKVTIYTWRRDKINALYQSPNFETAPIGNPGASGPWTKKSNRDGALSNWLKDETKCREQFDILLKYCKDKIPESSYYSTILLLKATAGLRLMTPKEQEQIIQGVSDYLSKSVFTRFNRNWASVMSGQEEGVGGWITTNYLTNSFSIGNNHTFGALDLGGASAQITFQVPSKLEKDYFNATFSSELQYNLYSVSYLGFGLDQVAKQVRDKVELLNPTVNPCRPLGSNETGPTGKLQIGGSDSAACISILEEIINKTGNQVGPNNSYMPPIPTGTKFVAFSGFFYAFDFFQLSKQNVSLNELLSASGTFCNKTYDEIQKEYSDPKYQEFLTSYCLYGLWSYSLLESFNIDTGEKVVSSFDQINNISLTWAPGVMLYETGLIPRMKYCSLKTDCKTCLESPSCGWCYKSEKCYSGNADGGFSGDGRTDHQCVGDWMFASTGGFCKSSNQPANVIVAAVAGGAILTLLLLTGLIFLWRKHIFAKRNAEYHALQ